MTINGGAALAILAFLGNLLIRPKFSLTTPLISDCGHALLVFLAGTGAAGLGFAARYLSQVGYGEALNDSFAGKQNSRWMAVGNGFKYVAILVGLASFVLFFYGAIAARDLFVNGS